MPDLKLPKLPDRTPVKLNLVLAPHLAADLNAYAALYSESYGSDEQVVELIPAILTAFLESDRAFQKHLAARK